MSDQLGPMQPKREDRNMKKWKRDDQATQDLIELVSDKQAPLNVIVTWTDEQCQQAEAWASARHFRASDNNNRVPPIPPHVAALEDVGDESIYSVLRGGDC